MYYSKKLQKYKNINHAFFSRKNGFSKGIYSSLNCGLGSDDQKNNIVKNLKYISNKMKIDFDNLVLMNQTHSNKVVVVDKNNQDIKRIQADALITNIKNIAISVLTADCVPILIYEKTNHVVACIHAGWKGAVNGIIENTFNQIIDMNKDNSFYVTLGPCIGLKSYEVDKEFYNKFIRESKMNEKFFFPSKDNKFFFDLRKYVNSKITKFDVKYVENIDLDTYTEKENFFSFRRSSKLGEKDYGRCISTIGLIDN
jgi:YfiH family protein